MDAKGGSLVIVNYKYSGLVVGTGWNDRPPLVNGSIVETTDRVQVRIAGLHGTDGGWRETLAIVQSHGLSLEELEGLFRQLADDAAERLDQHAAVARARVER